MESNKFLKVLFILIIAIFAIPLVHAAAGEKQWTTILASSFEDWNTKITHDTSGNMYLVGYSSDGTNFGSSPNNTYGSTGNKDAYVTKLDSNGAKQWTTILASSSEDSASSVTVDDSGNIYITGFTSSGTNFGSSPNRTFGSTGNEDIFVTKLNSNGAKQWTTIIASNNIDKSDSIVVDGSGNTYVTGFTYDGTNFGSSPNKTYGSVGGSTDAFVVKLDSNGAKQWTTILAENSGLDRGYSLVLDSSENIYISGYTHGAATFTGSPNNTYGSTGLSDTFVAKLDSDGAKQWTTILASTNEDSAYAIIIDGSGNTYVTGFTYDGTNFGSSPNKTYGSKGSEDAFITKLDSDGIKQWTTILASTSDDGGASISLDILENIFVIGYTKNGTDFGSSPNRTYGSSGSEEVYATKLDSDGAKQWTTILESTGASFGLSSDFDIYGDLLVSGVAGDGTNFGSSPNRTYGSTGSSDVFATKLSGEGGGNAVEGFLTGWDVKMHDFSTAVIEDANAYTAKTTLCLAQGSAIFACFNGNFGNGNVTLSNVNIYHNDTARKVVIDFDSVVPGDNIDANNHEIYIASGGWDNGGFICPNAKTLDDVNSSCASKIAFSDADAAAGKDLSGGAYVVKTVINSIPLYQISGLSGSGAEAEPPLGGNTIPEFSDIAYVLAAVLGAGGFYLIRRKKSF